MGKKFSLNLKVLAVLTALVMVVSCTAVLYSGTEGGKGISESGGGKGVLSLMPPPFIGVAGAAEATGRGGGAAAAGTTFLEEEAGISAYTNVGETIDLEKARTAFRTIENETDEYIIGSVPLPDYPETEDVHAYVHKDGWVVTYYLREEPAAKILDWVDYGTDEKIKSTKLEDGIGVVCDAANIPIGNIKYFDFGYPNADKLMIVADAQREEGTDIFNISLPSDFVFYERSYSHYHRYAPGCGYYVTSEMYIDEDVISSLRVNGETEKTSYGLVQPSQLQPDEFHAIKVTRSHPCSSTIFDAIVLIYREA